MTYQRVLDDFLSSYPDCTEDEAVEILNEVAEEVLMHVPLRKRTVNAPALVASGRTYSLPEADVRLWDVRYFSSPTEYRKLDHTSVEHLDANYTGWRTQKGTPSRYYLEQDETGGRIGFFPIPDRSSLAVIGASNTTPIVIATAGSHGLASGASVTVSGVLGNAAANGTWVVTVLTDSSFSLNGSVGNAAYTSGGLVLTESWPKVEYDASFHVELSAGTAMPAAPQIRRLFANGMRMIFAVRRRLGDDIGAYTALFEKDLAEQASSTIARAESLQPEYRSFRQRANWRRSGRQR